MDYEAAERKAILHVFTGDSVPKNIEGLDETWFDGDRGYELHIDYEDLSFDEAVEAINDLVETFYSDYKYTPDQIVNKLLGVDVDETDEDVINDAIVTLAEDTLDFNDIVESFRNAIEYAREANDED